MQLGLGLNLLRHFWVLGSWATAITVTISSVTLRDIVHQALSPTLGVPMAVHFPVVGEELGSFPVCALPPTAFPPTCTAQMGQCPHSRRMVTAKGTQQVLSEL